MKGKNQELPLDIEALLRPKYWADPQAMSESVSELYRNLATLHPEAITAREIRRLRRSRWAPLRASAMLLWSRRRPKAFLRAAERFLEDEAVVRRAVMEGLVDAAIMADLAGDEPNFQKLLHAGKQDPDEGVRRTSMETEALFTEYRADRD